MEGLSNHRIVVLIDMDCFFCQVETRLQPEYAGKPLAVVQYNQWELGGIIAVNYEAREFGVTRHMRGKEAKEKCPSIILASVPCLRGKADTSRYRSAGREVIDVIKGHCSVIERASVDEAYLDITDIVNQRLSADKISTRELMLKLSNTYIVGYSDNGKNDEEERQKGVRTWISNIFEDLQDVEAQKLAVAGEIVEKLRADILDKTGFECSAGIAQNKILAKLACGLHKPNRQTILPAAAVPDLYSTLPVKKVRNLGGKFGDVVIESLGCNVMGDLLRYSLQYLQKRFDEKTGLWLYHIARGIDNEPITTRLVSKSIGACKKFPGKQAIVTLHVLEHWVGELAAEVCERLEQDLEENQRRATLLTLCYHYYQNKTTISQSRSCALNSYKPERVANQCVKIITKSTQSPIAFVGISAGKFVPAKGSEKFLNYFKKDKLNNSKGHIELLEQIGETSNVPSITHSTETNSLRTESITKDKDDRQKNENVETVKTDTVSEKEEIIQDQKVHKNPNERLLEAIFSTETDESPLSKKLNKLIKSCNEHNKINNGDESYIKASQEVLDKIALNNYFSTDTINHDNFKESFFMNILKDKQPEILETINGNKNRLEKPNCATNLESKYQKEKLHECKIDSKDSYEKASTSDQTLKIDAPNSTIDQRPSEQECLVQLQEIFPDLNNIDPGILSLLPLNLQEDAKLYLKKETKNNMKDVCHAEKKSNNKMKSNKLKTRNKQAKRNSISQFLIKGNTNDSSKEPLKRCVECNQMIPLVRYNEHKDFHIAQNLQNEINKTMFNDTNMKRKVDISNEASAKRVHFT